MSLRWYAAHLKPAGQKIADKLLTLQQYEVLLPKCEVSVFRRVRRWAGRQEVKQVVPYIPGYLFVGVQSWQPWGPINHTMGVHRLLEDGGKPKQIAVSAIDRLVSLADDDGVIRFRDDPAPADPYKPGSLVECSEQSVFAHQIGVIERIDTQGRVVLSTRIGRLSLHRSELGEVLTTSSAVAS